MTAQQAAQLALAWPALLATLAAMLSRRASRWSFAVAGLMMSGWVAVTGPALIGAALGAGTLAGALLERPGDLAEADFSRTTRRLGLLAVAIAGAVVVLVRLAQVDALQAPYVFPVLATGIVSTLAVFAAWGDTEMDRAARLLLVVAAAGWTVATAATQPAAAIVAAMVLPLLALTGRLPSPRRSGP